MHDGSGNQALAHNPPTAQINITTHGSDWLWAVFSVFALFTLVFLVWSFLRPATHRVFPYFATAIALVTTITYFTLASDLGSVPVGVEFMRGGKVYGGTRQVFYVRYINWFISGGLVLLAQLLTAAIPWQHGMFVIFMEWFAVVSGLAGAMTESNYKWGYFTMSLAALLYIVYALLIPGRRHASAVSPEISRTYHTGGGLLVLVALLYPICWGVSEGGNVITPDSEAVFYGILDILLFGVYGVLLLVGHNSVEPDTIGLRLRDYDEGFGSTRYEKNGAKPAAPGV